VSRSVHERHPARLAAVSGQGRVRAERLSISASTHGLLAKLNRDFIALAILAGLAWLIVKIVVHLFGWVAAGP
jgi:hypothetical protein